MTTRRQIKAYATEVARRFRPKRIILFGSYAYGNPTRDSDVDLLVVLRHKGRNVEKAIEIQLTVQPAFPLDLLVRTPEKITQRLAWGDCFLKEIVTKGQVLYESTDRQRK
jgi:predicted nucleotidyltransferase